MKTGDIITAIDGAPIQSWQQCVNRIGLMRIGDQLTLTIDRHGATLSVPVTVGPRPQRLPRVLRRGQIPQQDQDPDADQ